MKKNTKAQRLQEELNKAKSYHFKYQQAKTEARNQAMLAISYAVKCGQALNNCKKLKAHGKWRDWVIDNFDKSYETAINYMRLANEWESDYITADLENGIINISQNSILNAIRNHKKRNKQQGDWRTWMTPEELENARAVEAFKNNLRRSVRFRMAKKLNDMNIDDWCLEKLFILNNDLRGWPPLYGIWDAFESKLKSAVEQEVEKKYLSEDIKYFCKRSLNFGSLK